MTKMKMMMLMMDGGKIDENRCRNQIEDRFCRVSGKRRKIQRESEGRKSKQKAKLRTVLCSNFLLMR